MPINWRSHWLWLVVLLTAVTAADYLDHVNRPGAPFNLQPMAWFAFTAASHVTLLCAAFGFAHLLRKLPISPLAADTFGLAGAVGLHVMVSGPLWNAVFWPESQMTFDNPWLPMSGAAVAYVIYRGIFWLIVVRLLGNGIRGES